MILKKLRIEKKLTMKQVGKKIGVAECSYCAYENGKREPSAEKVLKLAEVLGVDCETILKCFVKEEKKAE